MSNQKLVKSYSLTNRYPIAMIYFENRLCDAFEWMKLHVLNHLQHRFFHSFFSFDSLVSFGDKIAWSFKSNAIFSVVNFFFRIEVKISNPIFILTRPTFNCCSSNLFLSDWKAALSMRKWIDVRTSQLLTFFARSFVSVPKVRFYRTISHSYAIPADIQHECVFICERTVCGRFRWIFTLFEIF